MERLTENAGIFGNEVMYTITDKLYYKNSVGKRKIDNQMLINKLGEFEDFMEEQGFEDLKTFRMAISLNQLMNKAGVEHFKENQELKARWEKLKDFIVRELREAEKTGTECDDEYDYFYLIGTAVDFYKSLLKKMRELEENND